MGLFSKRRLSDGYLALVPGERRLDAVRVQRRGTAKPLVQFADSYEFDGDLGGALKRLRKPLGLAGHRCTTLLAHGRYQLLQADAPDNSGGCTD